MKITPLFILLAVLSFGLSLFLFSLKNDSYLGVPEEDYPRGALEPLQFFSQTRAFPFKDIPQGAYQEGFETVMKIRKARKNQNFEMEPWKSIGPTNRGGRTLALALDPDDDKIIWLGSASGGLWRTKTEGEGANPWEPISTGFPVLSVTAIAIKPNDSKIMYIGTGETYNYRSEGKGIIERVTRGSFGMGILKSEDGGKTWFKTLDWTYQQNRGVRDLIFDPHDPNIIFAATTEGVLKSTDEGKTWENVLKRGMVMDLAVDKYDDYNIYAGVGNLSSKDKGIYISRDKGKTWNKASNGLPNNNHEGRITVETGLDQNTGKYTVMAMIGDAFKTVGLYRSKDDGDNWERVSTTDVMKYQGWYCTGLFLKNGDPSNVLVAGVNIFKSTSGGSNLKQKSGYHLDVHGVKGHPTKANRIYALTDGGLYISDNFGDSYKAVQNGYLTSQFYVGGVSTTDPKIAIGGLQDNGTWVYSGSERWKSVLGGDGTYSAIDPNDDKYQYGAVQYLKIKRSSDRGRSFRAIDNGSSTAFLAPYEISRSNSQVLYKADFGLERTDNRGGSWKKVGPQPLDGKNSILAIGISATDPDLVYCATAPNSSRSRVFRSMDGGKNFDDITGDLPNRYPRRITVNPKNHDEVYIAYSGFGTGHVFKSVDGGKNWKNISEDLPDVPFHKVEIDPENPEIIYAASELTVFVSSDGGDNWVEFGDGFPEAVMVFDLIVSPSDRSIVAFTHGRGVYKTKLIETVKTSLVKGKVLTEEDKLPIKDARVLVKSSAGAYWAETDEDGKFELAAKIPNGSYNIYGGKWGFMTNVIGNQDVGDGNNEFVIHLKDGYYDDFILDFEWSVEGEKGKGKWEKGDPIGTNYNLSMANPERDHDSDFGDEAYVTGNLGGSANEDDVDDKETKLESPIMDLSHYHNPKLSYHKWFFSGENTPSDEMIISISNGSEIKELEKVNNTNEWKRKEFKLKDIIELTDEMKFIVSIVDKGSDNVLEAGIDNFMVKDSAIVGVNNIVKKENKLIIYPNPVVNSAMVKFAGNIQEINFRSFQIYSLEGRLVKTFSSKNIRNGKVLDLSFLPKGAYLLKSEINGKVYAERFVKK